MTKDWKKIARASGLTIPDAQLDRIAPSLDLLEATFRPLALALPRETDMAVTFCAGAEEGE